MRRFVSRKVVWKTKKSRNNHMFTQPEKIYQSITEQDSFGLCSLRVGIIGLPFLSLFSRFFGEFLCASQFSRKIARFLICLPKTEKKYREADHVA